METVAGYPNTLKLFQIPASKFWQVRTYLGGRIVKKSTKTQSNAEAIRAAKEFYNSLLLKQSQNLPLTEGSSFERVVLDLMKEDQARAERKEVSERLVSDEKYIFENDIIPFFRKTSLKDVTYSRINDYVEHLKHRGRKPVGTNTIKNHFVFLRKALKHAFKLGLLDRMPIFPKIKTKDSQDGLTAAGTAVERSLDRLFARC